MSVEGYSDDSDFFKAVVKEMESGFVPLLIKSPNNRNDHGSDRDCFVLDPSSNSRASLEMFKYLGAFIAFGIMCTGKMPLNLAQTVWKQILGMQFTLSDLALIDAYSAQVLTDLREHGQTLSDQEFEATIDYNFTTVLSNGDEVVLCENGEEKKIRKDNIEEFISLVVQARSQEASEQTRAIQSGINLVLDGALSAVEYETPRQLEIRVSGQRTISTEDLKEITVYPTCRDDHEIVERFWRVFEEFTDEEKSLYLSFVWGRRRLPRDLTDVRKHELRLVESLSETSYPVARTCFFQLDIPFYKDDEVCRSRLITAAKQDCHVDSHEGDNFAEQ